MRRRDLVNGDAGDKWRLELEISLEHGMPQ